MIAENYETLEGSSFKDLILSVGLWRGSYKLGQNGSHLKCPIFWRNILSDDLNLTGHLVGLSMAKANK